MPPHHSGKRLGPDGAVSAPKGSLRSGSSFFARLLQPFCLYQEVLAVVAANIKFLAFVSKIHHPEGSVSAFSDASVFRILSSVHGVWQSFPILGSLLGSLHGSAGLQAGHGSGSEFFSTVLDLASAFSARLARSGVLPRVDFQEYEEPVYSYSTYPDRRFSSRYPNILKMSPPFASSEGVSASGDRYQNDGV